MCLICDRINMIKEGTNPYFVKELEIPELHPYFFWNRWTSDGGARGRSKKSRDGV